jgi:Holliday junction DNA helicase RuvB
MKKGIDTATVRRALSVMEIDECGLDAVDRKILETIVVSFRGGPVGLDTLAASVNEDGNTLEDVIEPYLLQQGFIARTTRGRIALERAYLHLGRPYTGGAEQTRMPLEYGAKRPAGGDDEAF